MMRENQSKSGTNLINIHIKVSKLLLFLRMQLINASDYWRQFG